MAVGLSEDHVPVSRIAILELALEVAATMLILTETEEFPLQILDAHSSEPVDYGS